MHENNEGRLKFNFDTEFSLLRLAISVMINVKQVVRQAGPPVSLTHPHSTAPKRR